MSFKDIRGQDKAIQILKEYIKQSRLTGSYLFAGAEGVGKKLVAKTLAKALNCEKEVLDSCDRCISCLKIEKDQHPDVHILDGSTLLTIILKRSRRIDGLASVANFQQSQRFSLQEADSIKIEQIRQLQKDINLKPYAAKKKVFIIDNAHNLTAEASNALLKILEEPPTDSLIIMISEKPMRLFKTIISRCKIMKFYPLQRIRLEEILRNDFHLDNSLAHFLAYFCEGRLGRALKLKEIDIFREKNRIIDAFILAREEGLEKVSIENRHNVRTYLNILAGWFRDMYLIKIGTPHRELINLDRKVELLRLMHRYTFMDLYEILNSLSNSLLYLERNVNTKLLLSNLREDISYVARRAT